MINFHNDPFAQSNILTDAKRRRQRVGKAIEDDEEAQHSAVTGEHMQRFFDALDNADEHEQRHALGKVVETWRADNAAGGLPVYAHPPLPNIFANAVAQAVRSVPGTAGKALAEGITANLEPGTRSAVLKQLGEATKAQAVDDMQRPHRADTSHADVAVEAVEGEQNNINALFKSLLKHEEVAMPDRDGTAQANRIVGLKSLFEQARRGFDADPESVDEPRRATTLEYRARSDGPQGAEALPWNGERSPEQFSTLASKQGGWRWPWEVQPEPEVDPAIKQRNYETAQTAKELQFFSYDPADVAKGVPGWSSPLVVFDNRFPPGFPKPLYDREWFRQNERGFSGSLTRNQNSGDFAFLIRGVEVSDRTGVVPDVSYAWGPASVGQVNEVGEDIYQQLKRRGVLRELARGRRLMLIGHSQGAPQAQLLGVYLIVRALQDGTLTEEQALRSIIVRGFGGTGAAGALRMLLGPDGRPLKVPPRILEKIDAITYLLDADPARWGGEPYVGEAWLVDTPGRDKYTPDEFWARAAPGHPRSAYRAADYSTARRDTKKRKGSFPDTRDRD